MYISVCTMSGASSRAKSSCLFLSCSAEGILFTEDVSAAGEREQCERFLVTVLLSHPFAL